MSNRKSSVWKYFIRTDDSRAAKCKLCHSIVKASGNTTNLSNHLKRRHRNTFCKDSDFGPIVTAEVFSQPTDDDMLVTEDDETRSRVNQALEEYSLHLQGSTSSSPLGASGSHVLGASTSLCMVEGNNSPLNNRPTWPLVNCAISQADHYDEYDATSGRISNAILFMLAKDNMPLESTELEGFRYFLQTTNPLYRIPGRNRLLKLIDERYEVLSHVVKDELRNAAFVSLTAEGWTDLDNRHVSFSVHYMQSSIKSVTIGVLDLEDKDPFDFVLPSWLARLCDDWNITKERIVSVATAGDTDILKVVTDALGKSKHVTCFGHLIDLVVNQVLDSGDLVGPMVDRVKSLTAYVRQSIDASQELSNLDLFPPSSTSSWISTYHTLERFLNTFDSIATFLLNHLKSPTLLTPSEVGVLKDILAVLKPIEVLAKVMREENYVTGSKVIPLMNCLRKKMENLTLETSQGKSFQNTVLVEVKRMFNHLEQAPILAAATLLDPRFKKLHFGESSSCCAEAIANVSAAMTVLKTEDALVQSKKPEQRVQVRNEESLWSFHQELVDMSSVNNQSYNEGMPAELKHYLDQPTIDITESAVNYWTVHRPMFPLLSSVADKYLSVVATSIPVDKLFSHAQSPRTERRSLYTRPYLHKMMFLNSLMLEDWCI